MQARAARVTSAIALFATAIVTGVLAGFIAASFIWLVEHGIEFVWGDIPEALDVDPFNSWFTIAVPALGGLLIGLIHMWIGDYPRPMDDAVETWRSGERMAASVAPKTAIAALVILLLGGPVGFEAAIIGVCGGLAAFAAERIRSVGSLVRQSWGSERIEALPDGFAKVPYWLAGVSSLVAYRWIPFGGVDMGFRYDRFDREWAIGDATAAFVFALVITLPVAVALSAIVRAERSTAYERSPILFGIGGGVLFAVLALGNQTVLFSGQLQFQDLPNESNATLLYVAVAKLAALLIALASGWRGGPIFPLFTSVGALGIVVADLVDVPSDIVSVAALAAVSTVIAKGNVPLALIITLYVVPVSYGVVMITGCMAAVIVLAIARTSGLLDNGTETPPDSALAMPTASQPREPPPSDLRPR